MAFDARRNLYGGVRIARRAVGYGQDRHERPVVRLFEGKHNDARAVFPPFFMSGFIFVAPEIGIRNNETRFGIGDLHRASLFFIHQGVEMVVPRIDA